LLNLRFKDLIGKKVVITGEVGVGKTKLLAALIDEAALEVGLRVIVLDLAPEVRFGSKILGASVKTYSTRLNQVKYFRPNVVFAPRLQGRNREEVLEMAAKNASSIEPLLVALASDPPDTLFIDDLTIYLQAGKMDLITRLINAVKTFVATAYKGKKLLDDKGSSLSNLEKSRLESLLNDPKLNILEVPL